ncbi:MAG: protein kinase [Ruminococcus flavefaciens]|nr:protein kinase [Ruminococcus flavefaciens]
MGKLFGYIKQPLWDNWHIGEKTGHGTYSEVYKIYSGESISVLKVKPVLADSTESLQRKINTAKTEYDIMRTLKDCPYIVGCQGETLQKVTDLFYLFMIRMEYLYPVSEQENFLSERNILKIAFDIGKALEYMHGKGIVHCDVKPDNFFSSGNGIYKLGDFNISGYYGKKRYLSGTSGYTAPEVYNNCTYDFRSDIYSFGISLYRLARKVNISSAFSEIIMKACSPDVRDRYTTVSEMLTDISYLITDCYVNPAEYSC